LLLLASPPAKFCDGGILDVAARFPGVLIGTVARPTDQELGIALAHTLFEHSVDLEAVFTRSFGRSACAASGFRNYRHGGGFFFFAAIGSVRARSSRDTDPCRLLLAAVHRQRDGEKPPTRRGLHKLLHKRNERWGPINLYLAG
jgi:hypothetical protein